jgi:hypothetical protein
MSDFGGIVFIFCFLALIGMAIAGQIQYHRVKGQIEHFNADRPVDPELGIVDPRNPQMW